MQQAPDKPPRRSPRAFATELYLERFEPLREALAGLRILAPFAFAALAFLGGVTLMIPALTATPGWRQEVLRDVLPLPFAEASHLSASLVGLALIILARGLALRMALARVAVTALLVAGAVFSLARGLEWEETLLLLAVALALTLSRRAFHRKGDWRSFRPGPGWLALIVVTLVAVTAIGLLGYRNVTYRTDMWWSFAWHGDAPRFLRATLVLAIAVAALALDALINRPPRTRRAPVTPPDAVRALLATCPDSARQVALLGDKSFLVAPDGSAYLTYDVSGGSFVCLGGPVGDPAAGEALIWQLAEMADRAAARPVFYAVPPDRIAQLLDLGHAILKIGEVARVDLTQFTLDGPTRKSLRYARSRAARDGLAFDILPRDQVAAHIDTLRAVSDAWLDRHSGSEKGFSLGRFDPDYLAEFDLAVMRHDGRIVAFANLWRGAGQSEIAVDLMRHLPDQSPVLMDALMTEIILYAQSQGYRWFNLGGAPLSGMRDHPLAPVWQRIGTLVYRRGDEFYSFDGLRSFKQKFGPTWTPYYMTCPGGFSIPRALLDVALLISRPKLAP
jgi:phosphatidylglycerol lysyltransferase